MLLFQMFKPYNNCVPLKLRECFCFCTLWLRIVVQKDNLRVQYTDHKTMMRFVNWQILVHVF
jgi:hypothetical protein